MQEIQCDKRIATLIFATYSDTGWASSKKKGKMKKEKGKKGKEVPLSGILGIWVLLFFQILVHRITERKKKMKTCTLDYF